MTRAELIKNLKYTMKKHENDNVNTFGTNISLMCKDVLDYLEQEPSEDEEVIRVSKGTVKARKGRFVIYDAEWLKEHFNTTEAKLYGQPSEDCISRQAVLELAKKGVLISNGNYDSVCKAINELPSVRVIKN